jgi:hypothetical protein
MIKGHMFPQICEWVVANIKRLELKDVLATIEALRDYCTRMTYNPEVIDLLYERVVAADVE